MRIKQTDKILQHNELSRWDGQLADAIKNLGSKVLWTRMGALYMFYELIKNASNNESTRYQYTRSITTLLAKFIQYECSKLRNMHSGMILGFENGEAAMLALKILYAPYLLEMGEELTEEDKPEEYWNQLYKNSFAGNSLADTVLLEFTLPNAMLSYVDLSNSNLNYSELTYANLSYSNLTNTNLSHSNLEYCNLQESDLTNVNFSHVRLTNSNLQGAVLIEADLSYANLSEANLKHAILCNANLIGVNLTNANLRGADLTDVIIDTKTYAKYKFILGKAKNFDQLKCVD